jgi:mRNA-degrading endonuclease RelE of RelBE toxin-antitoxin system
MAPEAAKEFDALDPVVRGRVERALDQLAADPIALRRQIKRLRSDVAMRLRVGDWRIIFEAQRDAIIVWSIAHRREVYRSEP